MKYATVLSNTGAYPVVVGSVYLSGSKAVIKSRKNKNIQWLAKGIYHPRLQRDVTPEDGEKFMEALPYVSGTYLSVVMRGDE